MYVVLPERLVYDTTVSPTAKMVYAVLSSSANPEGMANLNMDKLKKSVAFGEGETTQYLKEDSLMRLIEQLEEKGYVEVDKRTVNINPKVTVVKKVEKKETRISDEAQEVLEYLFTKRIEFGFSERLSKDKEHLAETQKRLNKGATVKEMKSVIDVKFKDDYFLANPKYLLPRTLFRNKYPDYLATVVEETPFTHKVVEEEEDEIVGVI